ncbi:MAG: 30S ribosomal protein S9 [Candidatus Roizmanbacteria bacterium]
MVKKTDILYYEAVGRRKESISRVRLYAVGKKELVLEGTKLKAGDYIVNGLPLEGYFTQITQQILFKKPLELAEALDRFVVSIKTQGGGKEGQLEAAVHGISRALVKMEASLKKAFKIEGLLTRDPRTRERRKPGTGGKSRRKKQSPKR